MIRQDEFPVIDDLTALLVVHGPAETRWRLFLQSLVVRGMRGITLGVTHDGADEPAEAE